MHIKVEYRNEILGNGVLWEGPADAIEAIPNFPARYLATLVARDGEPRRDGMWHVSAVAILPAPIPMLLYCPQCSLQHIDIPAPSQCVTNPPHRSHECQHCRYVWRPCDVPTTGVATLHTQGQRDQPSQPVQEALVRWLCAGNIGRSSRAIVAHLTGQSLDHPAWSDYPRDGDDFQRCLRLLDTVPIFRTRLTQLSTRSPTWAQFVTHWTELEQFLRSVDSQAFNQRISTLIQHAQQQERL